MKYMLTYEYKDMTDADMSAMLNIFSTWEPPEGVTVHAFVERIDARGGYILGETDDLASLLADANIYNSYLAFSLHPVVDVEESVPPMIAGIERRTAGRA